MPNYVDVVANVMPWAGSLIPATLTFENVQRNLGFETGPALVIAGVVEGLGFVTVTTALDLYELRQAEVKANPHPGLPPNWGTNLGEGERGGNGAFWISVAGAAAYLIVVLMINSILDGGDTWHKITLGLLSTFGVLGGLMVALRKHLAERLNELKVASAKWEAQREEIRLREEEQAREARERAYQMEQERLRLEHELRMEKAKAESLRKLEKAKAESLRIEAESARMVAGKSPDDADSAPHNAESGGESPETPRRWADISPDDHRWIAEAPANEIVKRYQISGKDPGRTARTWKDYARKAINFQEAEL